MSTNHAGEVIIYSRDNCSTCKGTLNVEEIDRVFRNDRLEVDGPQHPPPTTVPAPILRASENCGAAQQHRRSSSATTDQGIDTPYRINASPRDEGGRNATTPACRVGPGHRVGSQDNAKRRRPPASRARPRASGTHERSPDRPCPPKLET